MTNPTPDTITVVLDRTYVLLWAAWLTALAVILVFHPPLWVIQAHLGWLVIQEGVALARRDRGLGAALSPLMQTLAAKASDGARWYQSFKALVSGLALLTALEAGYVVAAAWGWFPAGLIVSATLLLWLLYHWVRPEKYDR